jgi:hypothetical protein
MKKIINEYLEILNDYIEVEERGGKTYTKLIEPKELSIILETFWATEYEKIIKEIKNFKGIKTINHGIIPKNPETFIKRSSLYSDLIILEAPLDSILLESSLDNKKKSDMLLLRLSYELPKLNEITDWIDEGIITLVPPRLFHEEGQSTKYITALINDDLEDNNILTLIDNFYKEHIKEDSIYYNDPEVKYNGLMGAVGRLNDNLITTGILDAILTANDDYSWKLLRLKLEKEQKLFGKDCLSFAALNKVNVKFLDNVTLDFARKIREEGYLSELRDYFRETFKEIQKTPDESEFNELVKNYSIEIIDQVKMHEREWEDVKREAFEKFGVKGGLALSNGAIGGLTTFGLGIPAWIGFLGGVLVSSNYTIKDIVDEFLEFRRKRRDLQRNPIHLLYELEKI